MANTTAKGALSIHGTNPQFLIDKVVRSRIYDCQYWKESCFALTAESLIDKAVADVRYIGSTYANVRPTEFVCLLLKLLQLQPEKEIIIEYLRAEEFKYLRALAACYVRLTFSPVNVYQTLEPLLADYRKLRVRQLDGSYTLTTFDELVDSLLTESLVLDLVLPRLTTRRVLEETEAVAPRHSALAVALGFDSDDEGHERAQVPNTGASEDEAGDGGDEDGELSDRFISRSPTPASDSQRAPSDRYISPSPSPDRFISRSPTPEGERIEGDV